MEYVWVVTGHSESGDDYGPWVFKNKPMQDQLKKLVSYDEVGDDGYDAPNTDGDGPGTFGSYIALSKAERVVFINECGLNDFKEAINILKQHQLRAEAIFLICDNADSMHTSNGLKEAIAILENSTKEDVRDLDEVGIEAAKEAAEDFGYGENEITWNGSDFEGDTI